MHDDTGKKSHWKNNLLEIQQTENYDRTQPRAGAVSVPRPRRKKFLSATEQNEKDTILRKSTFYGVADEVSRLILQKAMNDGLNFDIARKHRPRKAACSN